MKNLHFFRERERKFVYFKGPSGFKTASESIDEDFDRDDARRATEGGKDYQEIARIQSMELGIREKLNIPGLINEHEQRIFERRLEKLKQDPNAGLNDYETLHEEVQNVADKRAEIHEKLMKVELSGFVPEAKLKKIKAELAKPSTDVKTGEALVESVIEEETRRMGNVKKYAKLLEENAHYFSEKSRKSNSYMLWFMERIDPEDQEEAISKFKDEILSPRKELMDQYEAFNSERQGRFKSFLNEGSKEKGKTIEAMKSHLKDEYRSAAMKSTSLSDESKDMAMSYFMSINLKDKKGIGDAENALIHLRNRITTEDKAHNRYKALPAKIRAKINRSDFHDIYTSIIKPGLKQQIDHKTTPQGVDDLCAEELNALCDYIDKNRDEFAKDEINKEGLQKEYSRKLDKIQQYAKGKGLKGKVLADQTKDAFEEWFYNQVENDTSKGKEKSRKIIEEADPQNRQYKERIAIMEVFEKLLDDDDLALEPERKKALFDEFNNKSYTERRTMVAALEKKRNTMKNPIEGKEGLSSNEIKHLKFAAEMREKQGKTEGAIKLYEAALELNPDDKEAQRRLEELNKKMGRKGKQVGSADSKENAEVQDPATPEEKRLAAEAIIKAKSTETMRKNLTRALMIRQIGDLTKRSDDFNKGQTRTAHLQGTEDAGKKLQLQEQMLKESGGKMLLGPDGKPVKKRVVDFKKFGRDPGNPDEELHWRRYLARHQDDKDKANVFEIEVEDREQGRKLTGNEADRLGQQAEQEALEEFFKAACAQLGTKPSSRLQRTLKDEIAREGLERLRGGRLQPEAGE